MDDDGYTGPATLQLGGRELAVQVRLAGHFEPITGSYRWYGRIAADPQVAQLMASGARDGVLVTPQGSAATTLSDVDPWGRPRVEGFGAAPFAVLDSVPE